MEIAIVGSGPAVEAVSAACTDVDARVVEADPSALGGRGTAVVVAPAGAEAFAVADDAVERWLAVEIGGVGGHPFADVDAAVSAFTPDSGGYADLRTRVASTTERTAERASGDRSAVRFAGAVAGRRLIRLLAGEPLGGTVVEVPGAEREFLPVPDPAGRDSALDRAYRDVDLDDALGRAERALDERVGPVTEVGERESFPVPYYLARTANTEAFSDSRAAEYAAGVAADWDRAFMKALGEALERYSAGTYRSASFVEDAAADRPRAVSPSRFVRPASYRDPDPEEPIQWVEGEDLSTAESAWLPAEFVHYPPPVSRHAPGITTGLGLGNSGVEALLSGLYEVIERDATMLAWYSTFEPLALTTGDDGVETLRRRARAEDLSVSTLLVTQDVDVPVVAAAVHREERWPRFAVGSGANLDAARAARSAVAEALQNWLELRALGPERSREEEEAVGRYADFPEEARAFVDPDGSVAASAVGPDPVPSGSEELSAVVERVADAGLDAYAARLTPQDVERLGFEAVRALIPAAQPLFTADSFFGERAERVPRDLGFEPRLDRRHHPYP